jgi:hypothetical protein
LKEKIRRMQDNYMEDSKELDPTEPENTVDPDE